ncbi:DNA-binding transcriptional ArsR family regulator [Aurantimicrobium minutum]|jgi:DNA-binding transcriptional ArsR family regulator|uniref:MarR family transcriptional regulator n=1 Tax=Aurantimicrobium minutum TaxID=708131 RepID=UPI002473EAE5|nr:MarR family transcriptional regulator [Aurantimicrobium minutum]MDH6207332.1 DNA-binding transcriptional ArsR family regulator [Aurantimicrobium minutum]MDH6424044.1 DNA-binding transcriptional ArsR family regulator [Aurantimicrobium minutum]
MKSSAPLLSPILRSDTQGRMLAALMRDAEKELSLTELAAQCDVAVPTILRDVDRLVDGGYVSTRRVGRNRLVRINTEHPIYASLWNVVMFGYGPAALLPGLLSDLPGIEHAYIYGSWAARFLGESGESPRDIDVLIVGGSEYGDLYEVAHKASALVGREVNINVITPERWANQTDGFVTTVKSRPLLELNLEK